jgi:hypothetical protein
MWSYHQNRQHRTEVKVPRIVVRVIAREVGRLVLSEPASPYEPDPPKTIEDVQRMLEADGARLTCDAGPILLNPDLDRWRRAEEAELSEVAVVCVSGKRRVHYAANFSGHLLTIKERELPTWAVRPPR